MMDFEDDGMVDGAGRTRAEADKLLEIVRGGGLSTRLPEVLHRLELLDMAICGIVDTYLRIGNAGVWGRDYQRSLAGTCDRGC
jgi:hypothetical protein